LYNNTGVRVTTALYYDYSKCKQLWNRVCIQVISSNKCWQFFTVILWKRLKSIIKIFNSDFFWVILLKVCKYLILFVFLIKVNNDWKMVFNLNSIYILRTPNNNQRFSFWNEHFSTSLPGQKRQIRRKRRYDDVTVDKNDVTKFKSGTLDARIHARRSRRRRGENDHI